MFSGGIKRDQWYEIVNVLSDMAVSVFQGSSLNFVSVIKRIN